MSNLNSFFQKYHQSEFNFALNFRLHNKHHEKFVQTILENKILQCIFNQQNQDKKSGFPTWL